MSAGGNIVDYHSCGFFPERCAGRCAQPCCASSELSLPAPSWFDLVVVLQANNTVLYERLEKRGYSARKLTENIDCEIFGVVLEEAHDSYADDVVRPMKSESEADRERNVAEIAAFLSDPSLEPKSAQPRASKKTRGRA